MNYMIRTTRGQYLRPMYSTATSGDVKQTLAADEKALREVSNLFRSEAPSLKVGQKLYALVWNTSVHSYWTIVGILTLTVEELGGGPESEAPEENAR